MLMQAPAVRLLERAGRLPFLQPFAAALMDLKLSDDDRIGGRKKRSKGAKRGTAKKNSRSQKAETKKKSTSRRAFGRSKAKKPLTFWRGVWALFYWGMVIAMWVGIGVAGIVAYYALQLPSSDSWSVPERPANIRIVAANGQLISNRGKMGGEAVALHELPEYVPAAFVAIEDRRFFQHFGLDPIGILGAMRINISQGRMPLSGNGGSTITQQVAKNLFLTPDQTIGRKIQEAVLAIWLEQTYSKQEILELYINRMYFGAGAYGIEAAAQRYFGKSARNLSLGEAAILAGVLKAPSALSPDTHPDAAAERARLVLKAMADEGYISDAEADAAAIDPNKRIRTRVAGAEYYVADWVETLMNSYIGDVNQDVIVTTTIDWNLQKEAEFAVREVVGQNGEERHFSQGALVSMTTDGAVKAIVGGVDYSDSQYNRAVTARRQPGSSFKPFVYLAGLEAGLTPDSKVLDAPFDIDGWAPKNYNDRYAGEVTLRTGLAYSLNTVAGRLILSVGPEKVIEVAHRLGISTQIDPVPSIALGTAGVSLLELTGAYAPFANGGVGVIPHVITRIETADGQVLYQNIPAGPGQVVAPQYVGMINDMLSEAVEVGTGKKAKLPGWQIAGKTGTTQENRDAVFVGYSARLVTGVWVGNDDNSPMSGVGGGSFPAEIWTMYMQKAHEGLTPTALPNMNFVPNQTPANDNGQQQQTGQQGDRPRTLVDLINQLFGNQ